MSRAVLAPIAPRVGQLVRMLSTDRDGEALAAVRALGRILAGVGLTFHELADLIEREPPERIVYLAGPREPLEPEAAPTWANLAPAERTAWLTLLSGSDCLKPFEANFIASVTRQVHGPTPKQAVILSQIIGKAWSHGWRA